MTRAPSFDDIFAVMAAASVGNASARTDVPDDPQLDDIPTRFAVALNVLLDDLAFRTDALRLSEQELVATLDSIGDAVIATDTAGRIVRMNPVAEALTGSHASTARGQSVAEVFQILKEVTREVLESPVDRVLSEGVVVALASNIVLVSRHDAERPIAGSAAPIRDAEGVIRGAVIVFRDRTVDRKAE
jgi:PAS domain S-box-containing protein